MTTEEEPPLLSLTPAHRIADACVRAGKSPAVILSLYKRLREWELCDAATAEARVMRVIAESGDE